MSTAKLTIATSRTPRPSRMALLLAFFVIYVVWGSTFLAIRFAVETIPPLLVVVLRQGLAGLAIFAYAWWRGFRPTWREWRAAAVLGGLYFAISHGILHWAETFVPSGLAALLISSEVIWIAIMAALVSRHDRLTGKTIVGLVIGIAGVALLTRAEAAPGNGRLVFGCIAVLLSAVAWACGVIYNRSRALPSDPVARAGMAAMAGAAQLLVVAVATGEVGHAHVAAFSARSVWSLVYLITFGSILAFTTYTWLLDHCSPTLVATHTYVNPMIAVLLGWAFAGEALGGRVLFAGLLTLASIFLISRGTAQNSEIETQRAEEAA